MVIHSGNQSLSEAVQEFWEYRDLLWMLTVRQVSVRYKQTVIGIGWVLLQPLVAMVIFSVIFGYFAQLSSDDIPYPIFVYSALILWTLFSEGLSRAGTSLIADERLITKVYFPRLIIPLAAVGSAWIDFVVSLILLLPLTYFYGLRPTWSLLMLPIAMVITMVLAASVGMLLSALNVRYRDFQYTVPFLVQVWLYASPVVYSTSIVPTSIRPFYYLNPMAGLIELSRFAVTGQGSFNWLGVGISAIVSIALFIIGSTVFRWVERSFADFI
ncbi:polysaccharide/polyol phosphate ABC transporter permease [Neosynechococcus sphagnicola sy1]|uniref:Transport permease protein n=1 Tax=Neosynechococcus sphagnicola sy1 TaxID=1497020 RepID=A0A098TKK0_9CYAN|nr:polysaccharide/polyol phosphate ABC transporter permease [Neosynechococcus sphagnicola sy1]